jgi:type VII secretion protein EccB
MQSALVRRDAVMLNDPMRTHSRATIVGVVLGAIGMIGFLVFGLISPQPSVPDAGNIVIGEQSGTVYVVAGNPKKLIPTFNMASARLLLMSQQNQAGAQQGGSAALADSATSAPAPKDATVVSDEQLANIPRGKLTGIPDGPQLLPNDKQRISNNWAVCDEIELNSALPDPTSINKRETTVLAGVSDLKRELGTGEALLAINDNGRTYLIYQLVGSPNQPKGNAVRAEVDLSSQAVSTALRLNAKPRKISNELLNAIPEVPRLTSPKIDGKGAASANMVGLQVGNVFSTSPAGGGKDTWVITTTGIQLISPAVADIIRTTTSGSQVSLPELGLDKIQNVKSLQRGDAGYLPVDDYPQQIPVVLDPARQFPVACLGWNITGTGDGREPHTAVFVGSEVPGPKDQAIPVGTPSPDGSKIDKFYMQPGFAAVVQSATVKETFGKGNIQLISDRGLRYGVPDVKTATALGLDNPQPAPDSIIKLLPTGASLNSQEVLKTFDSVPIDPNAGSFPTSQVQAAPK